MKIRKNDLLSVLKTEPMAPGNFVLLPPGHKLDEQIKDVPSAQFDVIGALVRTYIPSTRSFRDLNNICIKITKGQCMAQKPTTLIDNGNYLGALSAHFENVTVYSDDVVDEEVREELSQFVETYFPEEIEVQDA